MNTSIVCYHSTDEFLAKLKEFDVSSNPFYSYAFLSVFLKYNPKGDYYFFDIIGEDGKLWGIAPFECTMNCALLQVKKLRFLGYRKLNYCGYVCKESDYAEVHTAMMAFFAEQPYMVLFNYYDINDGSPLFEIIDKDKRCYSKSKLYVCPCLHFKENFGDFYKEVFKSSKKRTELKKFQKKLMEIGDFKIINVKNKKDFEENKLLLDQIYKVHSERFADVYATSFFGSETMRPYYSELIESLLIDEKAYISLLVMDETVIAFIFCLTNGHVLIDWIPAFDPAYSKYNLGTVQYKMLFEEMCRPDSPYTLFDYSKGSSVYKRKWAKEETANYQFLLKSNKGGWFISILGWLDMLKFSFKCWLRDHGILHKVKDWLGSVLQFFSKKEKTVLPVLKYIDGTAESSADYKFLYSQIRYLPVPTREEVLSAIYSGSKVVGVENDGRSIVVTMTRGA